MSSKGASAFADGIKIMRIIASILLSFLMLLPVSAEQQVDIAKLMKGATAGNAYDQLNLGAAYDQGIGVKQDIRKALHWYEKAAEQGLAEAQFNLAHLLVEAEISASTAAEWMRKAADQGLTDAEFLMGVIYAEGMGVEVNKDEARVWLQKAIDKGHTDAKSFLINMTPVPKPPNQ